MEANWLTIVLLGSVTSIAAYVGRVWFERWFNPLSIYSAIWGFCLCNYELGLIQYYPISAMAWFYVWIAWLSLYLGAGAALLMSTRAKQPTVPRLSVPTERLNKGILILSAIGAAGVLGQAIPVLREFGSWGAILLSASDIYNARTSNEISGLPYLGSFSFAACTLAGVHVAKSGKFTLVTLVPVVLVTIQLVFLVGRAGLGIAGVLFLVAALHTPRDPQARAPRGQRIFGTALIVMLLLGAFVLVSSIRGLGVDYPGITPAMDRISEYVPIAPSIYSNFSATPVAFSMYLSSPQEDRKGFWGMYTFAPLFRLLSKLGFPTGVAPYEENYWTPFPVNTGTYLKNLHSDFGPAGILIFPYVLGAVSACLIARTRVRPRLLDIVILSNIYVLIVFSFAFDFMLLGDWYIGTAASVAVAIALERGSRPSWYRQIPADAAPNLIV